MFLAVQLFLKFTFGQNEIRDSVFKLFGGFWKRQLASGSWRANAVRIFL